MQVYSVLFSWHLREIKLRHSKQLRLYFRRTTVGKVAHLYIQREKFHIFLWFADTTMSLKLFLCVLVLFCAVSLANGHFRFVRKLFNRKGKDVKSFHQCVYQMFPSRFCVI